MLEFPPFRLDCLNECLWRRADHGDEARIPVAPKAFAVLRYLIDRAGRLVTQSELLDAVWPDSCVQPEVLKSQILEIRRLLGDCPRDPLFIETLPRRGYRFIASLQAGSAALAHGGEPRARALIGRQLEKRRLGECLLRAVHGQRQVVFVTGNTGIGKTALVDEFQNQAATSAALVRLARGQCLEGFAGREAYYPILEAVGQLCRGGDGDAIVDILASQAPTWLVQFPEFLNGERRDRLRGEMQGATRERMLREISEALMTIASDRPLVLVLEDLHWADHSTIDLIAALARGRQAAKLLLIGTCRSAEAVDSARALKAIQRELLAHRLCDEIVLAPLAETHVAAFLAAESEGCAVPQSLVELIYRYTEGNPLFMLAFLEHMRERQLIVPEDGVLRLSAPLPAIELCAPERLRQMIEMQIERLSVTEREVLEVASVAGLFFCSAISARAASLDIETFETSCSGPLCRLHWVRPASPLDLADGGTAECYEFVHAVYREVLYRRQAPGRRAKLHVCIGEQLEANYAHALSARAPELAHHFECGGDWVRAIKYLQHAADAAGERFGPREASGILEHALELVSRLPQALRAEHEVAILERAGAICSASLEAAAVPTREAPPAPLLNTG